MACSVQPCFARGSETEHKCAVASKEDRLGLRQLESRPILDKLHGYLLEIQAEVLPKSPEGRAVRYTLKNWTALTRYCEDGDLQIDNNIVNAARGISNVMPISGLCRVH